MNTSKNLTRTLQESGYRLTEPRRAILKVLEKSHQSLSPEEILQRARQHHAALGLVTVYRTLELLGELGLVRRVHSEGRCHEYARTTEEQHHLLCRGCGKVVEFPCKGLHDLVSSVEANTGYRIDQHLLELTGLCPDCQASGAQAREG